MKNTLQLCDKNKMPKTYHLKVVEGNFYLNLLQKSGYSIIRVKTILNYTKRCSL